MLKHIFLVGLFLIGSAGAADAGTASGQVDTFWTDRVAFYFKTTGTVSSKPACSLYSRFVVPLNTDYGRAIAAQVAAAKSSGLTLAVTGRNECLTISDSEDILFIAVSGSPSTPSPAQFWATSSNTISCATVCSNAGGFAAANSSGQVCKGIDGKAYSIEFRGNFNYVCGYDNNRTSQCFCYKR